MNKLFSLIIAVLLSATSYAQAQGSDSIKVQALQLYKKAHQELNTFDLHKSPVRFKRPFSLWRAKVTFMDDSYNRLSRESLHIHLLHKEPIFCSKYCVEHYPGEFDRKDKVRSVKMGQKLIYQRIKWYDNNKAYPSVLKIRYIDEKTGYACIYRYFDAQPGRKKYRFLADLQP